MQPSRLSLRGLELFESAARTGSVQAVAAETGLSVSTVSHHILKLEEALGVPLLDHGRRPMVLTPAGTAFLAHVAEALRLIRRAEMEAVSGDLTQMRNLSLGLVEDFDSEVAPELAQYLAGAMPGCTFRHVTRVSHEILALLSDRKLDAGLATRPPVDVPGLVEYPVLRDPFVLATPAARAMPPEDYLRGDGGLPLLRYSRAQIIGAMIEAQLRRMRVTLPNRFELESNQSLMGMVAEGSGWAITTPTSFARAKRFHGRVDLHPFPGRGFSRTISLFTQDTSPQPMAEMIAGLLRRLIERHVVAPVTGQIPWLAASFRVVRPDSDG